MKLIGKTLKWAGIALVAFVVLMIVWPKDERLRSWQACLDDKYASASERADCTQRVLDAADAK